MRMVTMVPGGVFGPVHNLKDRPDIVYILQGTITDHRNGDEAFQSKQPCFFPEGPFAGLNRSYVSPILLNGRWE